MVDPTKFSSSAPRSAVRTLDPNSSGTKTTSAAGQPSPQGKTTPPIGAKPSLAQRPSANMAALRKPANFSTTPFWTGLGLSIGWVAIVAFAIMQSGSGHTFGGLPLTTWAIGISAIISPVAMIWMVTAYLQRAADVQSVAEPLRRQLMMITGESGAAEVRIRRFNQAIKEQLELLRSTQSINQHDLMAILDRVRQHKNDLEQFEQHSVYQVKEIQEVIRRSMQHIEQIMEDKFTMLRILDGKLAQSGDGIARQTDTVREQLDAILQEVETNATQVASALDAAMRDSKKLSDTARTQENSLLSAAESACGTLQELSGKIDVNIARFLERAGSAREEAERLAGALDTQTRALDEFSNTMPTRVSEAEAVLRGVADRLYASEQLAREQAVMLSEKLEAQVDGLQAFLDRFGVQINGIDGSLTARRGDLDNMLVRISETTDELATKFEGSIEKLDERAQDSLQRLIAVNKDVQGGTDEIAARLADTASRYEDAALRVSLLSDENKVQLRNVTDEIAAQLAQFEALYNASQQAGKDVENRAATALQNMQQVLERLLAARDATQNVGDALTEKLRDAVDQNEHIIVRINEAAQMTVRSLSIASETLVKQEGSIAEGSTSAEATMRGTITAITDQAKMAEQTLREQNSALMGLLRETQDRLDNAEIRLQDFAAQAAQPVEEAMRKIDASTIMGTESLGRYNNQMNDQLTRLNELNTRVGGMGEEIGRMTSETLNTIEQLNNRYLAVREAQQETARSTIEQFTSVADRLQREVGTLGDQTGVAVTTLQQAALQVGEQSQKLQTEAQESGAKIQMVTSALQTEASQIRAMLQKQADDLTNDLARAEREFGALGDALKQRTDAAYSLLDRIAEHYNDQTRSATQGFEEKAATLAQKAAETHYKVQELNAKLAEQLSLIGTGSNDLDGQISKLGDSSGKTLQQLSILNEKFSITQESTVNGAAQVVSRLDEANSAFMRQANSLNDAAQNASLLIQKAGTAFGEQTSKLLDATQQVEQNVRNLNTATLSFAEQSSQIRNNMEQHNQKLVSNLNETVAQLETTNAKLQQAAATATLGADQASTRFSEMTENASGKINTCNQELMDVAGKAEDTLGALGASITQQVASLNLVSDQITEQYKVLGAASENQRKQLVDLFDKLGLAHHQASDVAERTITRLTDSVQQIQRQLGTLSDQSQTVLANVRTAGTGFADQSSILLQSAQQAEQQARTILSVTGSLQEQARQLREALQAEGDRTSELFGTLLGKLNAGNTEMRELGSTAEITLTSLQTNIGAQTSTLNTSLQQIMDRQRGLTTALDAQRDVLNGLISRLTLAQDETATMAERSASRLTESAQQIVRQMEGIDAQAQGTLTSIRTAGTAFADEAGNFTINAQQAEQQARSMLSITAGMQEQARQMREAMQSETARVIEQLASVVTQLDLSGQSLKQQTSTATHALDETVLHFDAVANLAGEAIAKKAEDLGIAAIKAEERVRHASEGLMQHYHTVETVGEKAEQKARTLADTTEYATSRLATLADGLSKADQDGQNILENAGARIAAIRETLQLELDHVAEITRMAVDQIDLAGKDLVRESDTLRANLATSESALVQAADLVREETVQMPMVMQRGVKGIETASKAIQEQTYDANRSMIETADRFINVTGAVRDTMIDEMKNLGDVAETADKTLRAFSETLMEQVKMMKEGSEGLSASQAEMIEKAAATVAQLSSASDRLAQLRGDTLQTTEKLARDFETIESRATTTTHRLGQVSEGLAKHVTNLADATDKAEAQMLGATQGFRDQLERVRSGVQTQIDDINRGLMQITAQLERTGTALRTATAGTVGEVEKIATRFDQNSKETVHQLTDRTARMRAATEEVAKLLSGFGDQIDGLLNRLSLAGNGLKQHESDLVGRLQIALTHLGAIAEKLESNRVLTADVSDEAIARLTEVSDAVEQQMQDLKKGSETVTGIVKNVGQAYTEQAQGVNRSVVEAQSQVLVMSKSVEEMQQRTDRLRVALKLQGEDLLSSLEDILTQLSSTGDAMSHAVDGVLQQQAEQNLQKIS